MPGPPRTVSDAEKKRRRIAYQKQRRLETVHIGDAIEEWMAIKQENGIATDGEMAKFLIESFKKCQKESKKKIKLNTSTPWQTREPQGCETEASEHSSSSSVKKSRFEENTELDENGDVEDFDDVTYTPTEWEMSINIPPQENAKDNDITTIIHYIDLDTTGNDIIEEITPVAGIRKLTTSSIAASDEDEKKFMVFRSSLALITELVPLKKCARPECQQQIVIKERSNGCGLVLRWACSNGHEAWSWASQPPLPNSVMLGNFQFCSSILLSGNNYRKITLMLRFMEIGLPSVSSFNNIGSQKNYIVQEVNKYWTTFKQTIQEERRALNFVVAGDGRMESP